MEAASTLVMHYSNKIAVQLLNLQYETAWTLCWCLFLGGSNLNTNNIAHKGSQYIDYG